MHLRGGVEPVRDQRPLQRRAGQPHVALRRQQLAEQLTELVAKHWPEHARNFAEAFAQSPMLEGVDVGTLGARLQAVAPQVGAESHPFGSTGKGAPGMKTLIHGDPKVARAAWRARPMRRA